MRTTSRTRRTAVLLPLEERAGMGFDLIVQAVCSKSAGVRSSRQGAGLGELCCTQQVVTRVPPEGKACIQEEPEPRLLLVVDMVVAHADLPLAATTSASTQSLNAACCGLSQHQPVKADQFRTLPGRNNGHCFDLIDAAPSSAGLLVALVIPGQGWPVHWWAHLFVFIPIWLGYRPSLGKFVLTWDIRAISSSVG